MLRRVLSNYLERHRHPANQVLHLFGVPLTFVVSAVFAAQGAWLWAVGCFVGGYGLQFLGHHVEGNDAGELLLLKKWLGRPYVEFGPRSEESKPSE